MRHSALIKPDWACGADREVDLSDVWIEECDPENEDGALVTGYMESGRVLCSEGGADFYANGFHLIGICVEVDDCRFFYNREDTATQLGMSAIWRVEQHEMEAA